MNTLQRKLLSRFLMDQANDDGSGNGGGGNGSSANQGNNNGGGGSSGPTEAEIAKRIQDAVDREVAGLKSKRDELIDSEKSLKARLKEFDGIDPAKTREMLKRINLDEDARLIAEGKMDEVLTKRTEGLRTEYEKKLADIAANAEAADKRAKTYQGRVLDNAIRSAALEVGVHRSAIEDVLLRGRTMFELGDDGEAVFAGAQSAKGKDGKSSLSPTEWLESMKESCPHWFPAEAIGGGASGNPQSGNGLPKTMKRAAFERLANKDKVEFSKGGGKLID